MTRQAIVPPALAQAARDTGFSPAIRAGGFIYLTGATGGAPDGTMPGDVATQTRNALEKAQTVLQAADADLGDVVEMTSYFSDIDSDFTACEAVLHAMFQPPLPAWTAVEVAKLRRPGARIELRLVAFAPSAELSHEHDV